MQNTDSNDENLDPQHFPNTSADTTTKRSQNFSFASTYQPSIGHFVSSAQQTNLNSANSNYTSILPKATFNFSKPIAAFSVLNKDDLYAATKPNAIVRPIRRSDQTTLPGRNGQQGNSQQRQQQQQQPENDTDSSHTPLSQPYQYQLSGSSVAQPPAARNTEGYAHDFAAELQRKLHYLHSGASPYWNTTGYRHSTNDVGKRAKGKAATSLQLSQRPLFITTVPTGVFLPPPKELPLPPFLRPYVYSSHPVVLSGSYNSNYNKSPTFSKDKLRSLTAPIAVADKEFTPPTMTATATTAATTAVPSSLSSSSRINSNLRSYAQTLAGGVHLTKEQFQQQIQQHRAKRQTPPEPYKNVMYDRRVVRGSNFGMNRIQPSYEVHEPSIEERRQQVLRQKPNYGRHKRSITKQHDITTQPTQRDEVIQTDEELLTDVKRKCAESSVNTQTELLPYTKDIQLATIPDKDCVDKSTEISENELFFQYDRDTQSLLDSFVDMCFEQTVLEMAHEVELGDLRKKYEALEAQHSTELKRLEHMKSIDSNDEKTTTAAELLQGHIAKLVPEVLENLESADYIEPTKKDEVMKAICPWLTVEVAEEVGHIVDSREILTVIIEEIIKQRAAIYGDAKTMPEIVANIEEITPISGDSEEKGNE